MAPTKKPRGRVGYKRGDKRTLTRDTTRRVKNPPANSISARQLEARSNPSAAGNPRQFARSPRLGRAGRGEAGAANAVGQLLQMMAADAANIPQVSAPSRRSFMKPFNDAEQAANRAYNAAVPVIEGIFQELRQGLREGIKDQMQQSKQLRGEARRENRQQIREINQDTRLSQRDLAGQGGDQVQSLTDGLDQEGGNLRADARRAAQDDANVGRRLDQVARQSSRERVQDARLAEAAGLEDAQITLDQLLAQITAGRAQAEGEYNSAVQQAELQNYQMRQDMFNRLLDITGRQQEQAAADPTFDVAVDLLTQTQGNPSEAVDILQSGYGELLRGGLPTGGYGVNTRHLSDVIQLLAPSIRRSFQQQNPLAGGSQDAEAVLAQILGQ